MKLVILFLLFLNLSFASTSQTVSTIQLGGGINPSYPGVILDLSNVSNLLQFTATYVGGGGGNFASFYKWGANAGTQYRVAAGKILYITGIYVWCGTANGTLSVGYADTALSSNGTTSVPTNPVYFGNALSFVAGPASTWTYFPITGQIPASKYAFIYQYGAYNYITMIQGFEQ